MTLLSACVALVSTPAHADPPPAPSVYVGLGVGGHLVLDDWDMNQPEVRFSELGTGGLFGLSLGAIVWPALSLEGQASVVTGSSGASESNLILLGRAQALLHPWQWTWSPHLSLGGGVYSHLSGDLGPDTDSEFHVGLGVRGMLARWVALRLDAQYILTDGVDDAIAGNMAVTVGVDMFVWGTGADKTRRHVTPPPRPFPKLKPPVVKPKPIVKPKPVVKPKPKPIVKPKPKPIVTPKPVVKPEPDRDTDGDGVLDKADRCPKRKETKNGFKDDDGCPDEVPRVHLTGSRIEIKEQVRFAMYSSRIKNASKPMLKEVAAILQANPRIRVRIEGHNQKMGYMKLSQKRAESVMRMLVLYGVAKDRLEAVGMDATRPLVPFDEPDAGLKNRRVEFHVLK